MMRTALLCALLAAIPAHAQTINKCTVDGKITYTEQPCQGGSASVIAVPEAQPANPEAAAELKRMQAQSQALEKERHQREARDERQQVQQARAARAYHKQCGKLRMEKKWADDEARNASVQDQQRARSKAQRAADKLALEC